MEKKNKLRVFTGFAGYGGDKFALQLANIDYQEIGFSEIDKYAIQCHKQNHKGENFGSITEIDPNKVPDFDLFTGGFPCQAFSTAGKGQGVDDEKGRGLLFNEIIRICEVKKPKYILLENVKGLMSKKHKDFFEFTQSELKRIGYNIDVSLYNSKNYGIPQNRERVFYVCVRNDLEFNYTKPTEIELKLTLKDILEDSPSEKYTLTEKNLAHYNRAFGSKGKILQGELECNTLTTAMGSGGGNVPCVDEKYYLSEQGIKGLLNTTFNTRKALLQKTDTCNTLLANDYKEPKCIFVKNATKQGYLEAKQGDGISLEQPNSKTRRGRVQNQMSQTLQCGAHQGVVIKQYTNFFIFPRASDGKLINGSYNRVWNKEYVGALNCIHPMNIQDKNLTIRKLTPTECFRLMGFLNDQINLDGLSNTQKYKLAGNGWEINLVSLIMRGFLN